MMSCGPVGRGGGAGRRRAVAWAAAGASRRPPHPLALTLAGATVAKPEGRGKDWDSSALPPLRFVWKFIREKWERESLAPRLSWNIKDHTSICACTTQLNYHQRDHLLLLGSFRR
ncbi:unnamed protein product [Coccothraustes coccothraustes]